MLAPLTVHTEILTEPPDGSVCAPEQLPPQRRGNSQLQDGQVGLQVVGVLSGLRLHVALQRRKVFWVVPVRQEITTHESNVGGYRASGSWIRTDAILQFRRFQA